MYVFSCVPHYSWPHMLRNIHAFIFVFVCVCLCINIWHCKEWLYYKSKGNLIYRDIVQCMHFPISMEQWNKWSIVTRKCLLVSIYEIAERLRTVEHQHRVLYRFYRRPVSIKKKRKKLPRVMIGNVDRSGMTDEWEKYSQVNNRLHIFLEDL